MTEGSDEPAVAARDAPSPSRPSILKRVAVAVVALAAIAFVVTVVPMRDRCTDAGCEPGLVSVLRATDARLVAALFGVYLAGSLAWAARWRALLGAAGVRVPLLGVWRVTLEAQAGGILLPGGVAGDALRVAYVRGRAPEADLGRVIASVLVDRVVGLATLATMACVAAVAYRGSSTTGLSFELLAAVPVGGVAGWIVLRRPELARARFMKSGLASRTLGPMVALATSPGATAALARAVLFSSIVSGVQLVVVRGVVAALGGAPTHEAWVYVGSTFGAIVAAFPALPGAWGTADAAYVFFLGQAGVSASVAASTCMVVRVFWYATGLIGAALALGRRAPSK